MQHPFTITKVKDQSYQNHLKDLKKRYRLLVATPTEPESLIFGNQEHAFILKNIKFKNHSLIPQPNDC